MLQFNFLASFVLRFHGKDLLNIPKNLLLLLFIFFAYSFNLKLNDVHIHPYLPFDKYKMKS